MRWQSIRTTVFLGLILGLVFGFVDLILTWRRPLVDDSPIVLLCFYGPMFLIWSLVSYRAARKTGRLRSGVTAGMVVAFATFAVFIGLNFLRFNLFLNELTGRPDWQDMMMSFRTSELESLRLFVNLSYLKSAPLKIAAATGFGAAFGVLGGALGWLTGARANMWRKLPGDAA
jgi:hypothetical protein